MLCKGHSKDYAAHGPRARRFGKDVQKATVIMGLVPAQ